MTTTTARSRLRSLPLPWLPGSVKQQKPAMSNRILGSPAVQAPVSNPPRLTLEDLGHDADRARPTHLGYAWRTGEPGALCGARNYTPQLGRGGPLCVVCAAMYRDKHGFDPR